MADIILLDGRGEPTTYSGVDVVEFDTVEGKRVQFREGTPVSKNVVLDFSEGNTVVKPGRGEFLQEINILKPGNLIPEYIKKNVNIAGIIGTLSGSSKVVEKDVNFYDYDGTLLYSYYVEDIRTLTELPALPEQDGLICQGWNFTLEDILSHNRSMDIGATYITDDGKTRLYINITNENRLDISLNFNQSISNGVIIDWGDNSTETLEGTGNVTATHIYQETGEYVISLNVDENCILQFGHGDSIKTFFGADIIQKKAIRKIEIGNNSKFSNYAFYNSYHESVTIPQGIINQISHYCFEQNYNLKCIVIPSGVISIEINCLNNCNALRKILLSNTVTTCNSKSFSECNHLSNIFLPDTISSLSTYIFMNNRSLNTIVIPKSYTIIGGEHFRSSYFNKVILHDLVTEINSSAFYSSYIVSIYCPPSVTQIGNSAFYECKYLKYIDFKNHKTIPTLGSNVFYNTPSDFKILVPAELYDQWVNDPSWITYKQNITPFDNHIMSISKKILTYGDVKTVTTTYFLGESAIDPIFSITSNNELVTISNVSSINNVLSFDITGGTSDGTSDITVKMTVGDDEVTTTFNVAIMETIPTPTYTVEAVDGVAYGFELNDNDYYESTCKKVNNGFSICKVTFNTYGLYNLVLDCINYAETNYDYGILSTIDNELSLNNLEDSQNVYINFKSQSSDVVQTIVYENVSYGEHFIYVKYKKDGSGNNNNDSLQFKVRFEEG